MQLTITYKQAQDLGRQFFDADGYPAYLAALDAIIDSQPPHLPRDMTHDEAIAEVQRLRQECARQAAEIVHWKHVKLSSRER